MSAQNGLLAGRVAVVSGAGPGLGRAICVAFAEQGAKVVVGDIDRAAIDGTIEAVVAAGGEAVGHVVDITDPIACQHIVDQAVANYGSLDILVNDAYHGGDYQRFEDADLANWKSTADVNVWGTLTMTQAALSQLKASGAGRIVMICTHGVELIQPTFGAYTTSKSAVAHATQLLAAELGQYGIRVNAVFPGPIFGAALAAYLDGEAASTGKPLDEVHAAWAAKNALRYLVPAEEIAGSVVYLASDLALPVTGQALYVNAGETFH